MKSRPEKPYGLLKPNSVPTQPWEVITIDFIMYLPKSIDNKKTYDSIMVVVDRLTKRAHFYPISSKFGTKDLADILYTRVYPLHGLPRQIISDRGVQFASKLFKEFCQFLNIEHSMSTAYHPQTDGQTERVNQTLEQCLRWYVNSYRKDNWSRLLPTAEFAYNNVASETTRHSPFFVELGRHPLAGPSDQELPRTVNPDLNDIAHERWKAQQEAKAAMLVASERWKWYSDRGHKQLDLRVGDKVLVSTKDYQTSEKSLAPRYIGPFKIAEVLSPVTFRLTMGSQYRQYHPVFHASKLVPYVQTEDRSPSPELSEDDDREWEVSEILNHRKRRGKLEYLVQWSDTTSKDDTWEPEENLEHSKEVLDEYKAWFFNAQTNHLSAHRTIAVAEPDDDPNWKVGDRYLWPDDWPMHSDNNEDGSEGYDSDQERPVKPTSRWLKRDPFGNFVEDNIVFNDYLEFAVPFGDKDTAPLYPVKGTPHSAGYDIYAMEGLTIQPGQTATISTGLQVLLPYGHYGQLATRSSMAKQSLIVLGGVIDWDYRGEVKVMIHNLGSIQYEVKAKDKVAQLLVHRMYYPDVHVSSPNAYDLLHGQQGQRGTKGFGSTGK